MTQKLQLHLCILTTIWLGLVAICNDTEYPDILDDALQPIHKPIQYQTRLGWDQLYQGHLSADWAKVIAILHPHLQPTGAQAMISMVWIIWTYILDMWKPWNQHLHHVAIQLDLPDYKQDATTLYKLQHQQPPEAQAALYWQPLELILDLLALCLHCWVKTGYKYYNQQLKAAKKQARYMYILLYPNSAQQWSPTTLRNPAILNQCVVAQAQLAHRMAWLDPIDDG